MKAIPFHLHRRRAAAPRRRGLAVHDDSHAFKRRALERWENEGGLISDFTLRNGRAASPVSPRAVRLVASR